MCRGSPLRTSTFETPWPPNRTQKKQPPVVVYTGLRLARARALWHGKHEIPREPEQDFTEWTCGGTTPSRSPFNSLSRLRPRQLHREHSAPARMHVAVPQYANVQVPGVLGDWPDCDPQRSRLACTTPRRRGRGGRGREGTKACALAAEVGDAARRGHTLPHLGCLHLHAHICLDTPAVAGAMHLELHALQRDSGWSWR
eukprot:2866405-Rhodomonas_salina.4